MQNEKNYRILASGDCAVSVDFGEKIAPEINRKVHLLRQKLKDIPGITETVPSFRALLVCFDPLLLKKKKLLRVIKKAAASLGEASEDTQRKRIFHIPVCYGGAYGEDFSEVCRLTGLSPAELIKRHSAPDYLIYMLGFLPGFPYLGGLDESIAVPRLASPRTKIPVGAVGIGGEQTGIYPLASPGGWQLIGRTPLIPYDETRDPAILYEAGDYIRFIPIDEAEYARIEKAVQGGTYECEVTEE